MILAAIDIGSNAARLLIHEVKPYKDGTIDFTKLNLLRIPLRLGIDVFTQGHIGDQRRKMLMSTMKAYQHLLDIYEVSHFRACATSAMRDAGNSSEIIAEIKKETGINIELITGKEEAAILYETHIAEHMQADQAYMYIDVGGGSTEVTLFAQNKVVFKHSFNIGTIRLMQNAVSEENWAHLKWYIKTHTQDFKPIEAIGTGGNINKVFSLSKKAEGKPLSYDTIREYLKTMEALSVEERIHQYGLKQDRADVLVPALQLYTNIMRWAGCKEIFVPKIGLADGIIKMLYKKHRPKKS